METEMDFDKIIESICTQETGFCHGSAPGYGFFEADGYGEQSEYIVSYLYTRGCGNGYGHGNGHGNTLEHGIGFG